MTFCCRHRWRDVRPQVLKRWVHLIKKSRRVRKLQRIWGILGPFLRDRYSKAFKTHLLAIWPEIAAPANFELS